MTIFSSIGVGVNGLFAHSSRIATISQNISNVTTVGYKEANTVFEDLVAYDRQVPLTTYAGAAPINRQETSRPGDIAQTASNTDIAVSGRGFFAVSPSAAGGTTYYTRAGSFTPDKDGNFVNTAGFFLQGWRMDNAGNLPAGISGTEINATAGKAALTTVNVQQASGVAVPTGSIELIANLDSAQAAFVGTYDPQNANANLASGAVPTHFNRTVDVVDSGGKLRQLTFGFLKTDTNAWAVEVYGQSGSVAGNVQAAAGTLTFNGDGTLASISPSLSQPIGINWQTPAATSAIRVDWGTPGAQFGTPGAVAIGRADGISQLATGYSVTRVIQDGHTVGGLENISIDDAGYVSANYSNGDSLRLYRIPLAGFHDPNLLATESGDVFLETNLASAPVFGFAGGFLGAIQSSALEQSNVDLTEQFSDLIIAQRAYEANTRLITTSDTMLETLTQVLG